MATNKIRSTLDRTGDAFGLATRDLGTRVEELRAQASRVLARTGTASADDRLQEAQMNEDPMSRLKGSSRLPMSQDSWPPALRAIAVVGGVLGVLGLTRRMMGAGSAEQAITVHKTIYINATPDSIFDLWSKYENFPRFMSHVQEVRDLGNGRSHWIVSGPAGTPVEWDATLTESRRPEVLAWQSDPGSTVENAGMIRFEPEGNGTRVTVHLSYTPPAGALGHAVAALFRADPKQQMDDDLMRMKAFIETGNPPQDAAKPGAQAPTTLH